MVDGANARCGRPCPQRLCKKSEHLDVAAGIVEVHFADAFFLAHEFDLLAEHFPDFVAPGDGGDGQLGRRAVGSLQFDGGEAGEAHPPGAGHEAVLDAVKLDLVDVMIEHALAEPEALGRQFINLAADDEVIPDRPEEWNDEGDESQLKENPGDTDGGGDDEGGDVLPEVEPLGRTAFPELRFFGHAGIMASGLGSEQAGFHADGDITCKATAISPARHQVSR